MLILKRKKCRKCEKLSLPNRAICYDHFREHQRELRNRSQANQDARRAKKTERRQNSLAWLKDKAWKLFSRYIRYKDVGDDGLTACYTCGHRKNPKILQAGHYHHRRLDYDERNIHPQCKRCNKWLHGNLAVYGVKLAEELGADGMKALLLEANTKGNGYTVFELKEIINKLTQWNSSHSI